MFIFVADAAEGEVTIVTSEGLISYLLIFWPDFNHIKPWDHVCFRTRVMEMMDVTRCSEICEVGPPRKQNFLTPRNDKSQQIAKVI